MDISEKFWPPPPDTVVNNFNRICVNATLTWVGMCVSLCGAVTGCDHVEDFTWSLLFCTALPSDNEHSFRSHLIEMSSLAGALDGHTHPRHSKMHYNPIVEAAPSRNESEAQDEDEEMDDDLFGNDNDVEEQKRLRSVHKLGIGFLCYLCYIISLIPRFQNTCIANCFRAGFWAPAFSRTWAQTGLRIWRGRRASGNFSWSQGSTCHFSESPCS